MVCVMNGNFIIIIIIISLNKEMVFSAYSCVLFIGEWNIQG